MEKQVAYGDAIGSKREITAMMRDGEVIAVERKEVGIAKSGIDVSQTKTMQKEKQKEV